ncbi:hypothetical protein [Streptomyces sp. Qhu_M48]|uniref:hypothetical protein n=1 Tax=Streptomyces sp. Qhu_M48 TaxID=3435889 RepID=UPI003F4FED21
MSGATDRVVMCARGAAPGAVFFPLWLATMSVGRYVGDDERYEGGMSEDVDVSENDEASFKAFVEKRKRDLEGSGGTFNLPTFGWSYRCSCRADEEEVAETLGADRCRRSTHAARPGPRAEFDVDRRP